MCRPAAHTPPSPAAPALIGTGSNFAPTYDYWDSEYKRTYKPISYKQAFNAQRPRENSGVASRPTVPHRRHWSSNG